MNEAESGADSSDTADAETNESDEIEPGTILTETALELNRSDRIEVQRRLNLLGYSTRGVDGVFGPGTRAGISQWQVKNGMPISGYLSSGQIDILNVTSEALYQDWLVNNANTNTTTTRTTTKRKYYRGADGCLRTRPGNARKTIIPGQSKFCNQRRRGQR
jgi:peptidoglycan hydrolase-like protein with peptidoglycan-binding domain